jgi:putative hydrolase of the HAD superfamily
LNNTPIRAVLFDFGGVITTSPFEAFRRFEQQRGLPDGFIQSINRDNADNNAWARFERGELTAEAFDEAFAQEARDAGHEVRGLEVVELVYGRVRPRMVKAVQRCRGRFITACLTNNFRNRVALTASTNPASDAAREQEWRDALALFDQVIESSKVGARKPEKAFFELACNRLSIDPAEAVFLDDLGTNLKPARSMGMRTIKVTDPDAALTELGTVLGMDL